MGMKQTEIGEIPEDWQISDLKSVTTLIQNGLFFEPKRKGKGIPLINVGDMYKSSPVAVEELDLFEANSTEKNVYKVKDGDLFFTRSSIVPSGIAFCNVYFDDNRNIDVVFDSHLIKATPKTELVDPKYLYLNCTSKVARNYFVSVSKSAIMTTIDQQGIRNCPVLLPPRQEQKNISTVLADTDNLIQATEQLINKKQLIKTATMQNLLTGKIRLAEFDTKQTKPSELGEIPSDWDVIRLKSIGKTYNGLTGKTKENFGIGNSFYVPFTNVMANIEIDQNQIEKVEVTEYQNPVLENDILFNGSSETPEEVCFSSVVGFSQKNLFLNSFCFGFRISDTNNFDSKFIAYWFRSETGRKAVSFMAQGSTRYNISKTQFLNLKVALPSYKEQVAIVQILSDMDKELTALNQRLTKLNDIKKGLMQNLLTGKIRLTE